MSPAPGLAAGRAGASMRFAEASVRFEQNATDGDVEVVFEVKGSDDGLARLSVVSPDGRTVLDAASPDPTTMGIRQFRFESPEPRDAASLRAAYPEGMYVFSGATAKGVELRSESRLTHALPETVSILRPGSDGSSSRGVEVAWTPVADLDAYIVEIEQSDLDVHITARLPGSATSFPVPDGFLVPGMEYDLAVGAVAAGGNISFVETAFETAEDDE